MCMGDSICVWLSVNVYWSVSMSMSMADCQWILVCMSMFMGV
jgi:hypothetical protein